jgi:hypothetical protein
MTQHPEKMQSVKMIGRALENVLIKLFRLFKFAAGMTADRALEHPRVAIPQTQGDWLGAVSRRTGTKLRCLTAMFRCCPKGHKGGRVEVRVRQIRCTRRMLAVAAHGLGLAAMRP